MKKKILLLQFFFIFLLVVIPFVAIAQIHIGKLSIKGNINADLRYYKVSKPVYQRSPFTAVLNATPEIKYGKWNIPVRILMGNYQAPYRDFNRFGISPTYKWIKIYAGHSTLNWSPFILEGRPILGAGVELTPDKYRIGVFTGMLNRASEQDTFNGRIFIPVFRRNMMSLKLGYGTRENYIDLIVLKATDKESSLDTIIGKKLKDISNAVYGINAAVSFLKNFIANANIAYSSFTSDNDVKTESKNTSFNSKLGNKLITANATTIYAGAYQAGIKYRLKSIVVLKKSFRDVFAGIDYSRIEPGYQSTGLYYLINDIERYRLNLQGNTADYKLFFSGNLGLERNNILNTQKMNNRRIISGLNANYKLNNAWIMNLSLQNYAIRLGIDRLNVADTLVVNQVNRNAMLSVIGNLGKGNEKAQVNALFNYQSGKNIIGDSTAPNLNSLSMQAGYRSVPVNKFIFSPSLAYYHYKTFGFNSGRMIPSIAGERNFKNNKYSAKADIGFIITYVTKKYSGLGWRNSLSGQWNINPKNVMQLYVLFQQNYSKVFPFWELQANVRYGYRL